ncbi:MAG TPA: penicillin-binding protein 1B [Candidatus Anaerobiospirillum pullistercoris]|uniref:Penicillin-binding protein 1B n=1 Tax=Candidatus Anaerobiospirillum pullistercoris TaxID=2838452 RepID=A0A9D1WBB9_9GAMM|nr:penicillin-binding protein 1B [Candidatus Anaerobiospirillum pullistercoris]
MRKAGLLPPISIWRRIWNGIKYLFSLGLKLTLVGICISVVLFIYFDAVVIDGYEVDDKWVLPAVVYSRPLELYPDQRLSLKQMVYELELLQYRKVESPRRPGEYAVNEKNGRLVLIKRPFSFPDGEEKQMSVLVEFDDKRVERIVNAETMQELAFMRMDPVLLDRINRINPEEDRIFISLNEVPPQLITTLLEIEDRSYYQHFGINPVAIARAFVKNMVAGHVVEGGSTITQQLVKNYFLTNERSYSRKLKEIFMAIAMNHRYTKDQILEAYMNEIYLGQNGNAGIYGFGLASYFYFGVPVSELSLDQMALLVGLIKGPSYYDPWRYPDHALERRNTVLAVLRNRGHISPEVFEEFAAKPIKVIPRGQLSYRKTPAFMGLVKTEIGTRFKEEEERTGKDFLSGNGIRIFTSLDPQAQIAAETAVSEQIAELEKSKKKEGLEAAMVVSSWRTGEVSAVVGSADPKYDGFNRALDSRRQVGSLIKPFVYLTAFHQGYHLGSIVNDSPVQVKLPNGDIWAPKNDDKRFRGPIRVIRAMASSLNVPTVRVGMGAGLDNVVNTLHAAGFKRDVNLYPSIVLGTPELSPYELNSMYVGMATEGIYRDLTTLRTIEKNGEIVYQRGGNRSARTLDPKDTYLALYGMTEATRSGTGRRIGRMFPDVTIASKTGTTNDFRDSWTVGMDSDELVTVWVGFDNNKSTGLYGSSGAMLLYAAYLQERGVNSLELNRPDGIVFVNFDKEGNVLANGCEEDGMEMFPARADRIQYVKQCNNFGEQGYDDVPFVDAPLQNWQPQQQPMQPQQPMQQQPQQQPNMQFIPAHQGAAPASPSSNAGFATGPAPVPQPNSAALNSDQVQDSGAQDVEPVQPDMQARPTQSSSENIERQADSFEEELLGIF